MNYIYNYFYVLFIYLFTVSGPDLITRLFSIDLQKLFYTLDLGFLMDICNQNVCLTLASSFIP
jgi:hypothetical protein